MGVRPDVRNGIRGVFATSDIRSGDTLVAVPLSASITVVPGERTPFQDFIPQDVWAGLPWYGQLACRLLHERSLGPASRFADYLPALPPRVDLPAAWPRGAVTALQYPYLEQQILDEQQEWERLFDVLRPHLTRRRLTSADLQWALTVVRSRTFAGPHFPMPPPLKLAAGAAAAAAVAAAQAALGLQAAADAGPLAAAAVAALPAAAAALGVPAAWQAAEARRAESGEPGTVLYAVCPFIDMFNHDSGSQSECAFAPWRREFRVAAGEPYGRGAQVLINYGSQSNDALLQRYGFVQMYGNPHDRYVLQDLLGPLERALREGPAAAAALALGPTCGSTGVRAEGLGGDATCSGGGGGGRHVTRAELAEAARRSGAPAGSLEQVPVTAAGFPPETVQAVTSLLAELSRLRQSHSAADAAAGPSLSTLPPPPPALDATAVHGLLAAVCRAELAAARSSLAEDEAALEQLAAWEVAEAAAAEAAAAEAAAAEAAAAEAGVAEPAVAEVAASGADAGMSAGAGLVAGTSPRSEVGVEAVQGGAEARAGRDGWDAGTAALAEVQAGSANGEGGPSAAEAEVPQMKPVAAPAELEAVGGDVERLRTVLMFRIAKKRVLSGLAIAAA